MNQLTMTFGLVRRCTEEGRPLGTAIEALAATERSPRLRHQLQGAAAAIAQGESPGVALGQTLGGRALGGRVPGGLAPRSAALLTLAQTSAALSLAAAFIQHDLEERDRLLGQLRRELAYPLTMGIALVVGIAVFRARFLPVGAVRAGSVAMMDPRVMIAGGGVAALLWATVVLAQAERSRRRNWALILAATAVALRNGWNVATALDRAGGSLPQLERCTLQAVATNLARGAGMAQSLAAGGFPPAVCRLAAAEPTASALTVQVEHVAWVYRRRADARWRLLVAAIQPLSILVLGLGFLAFVTTSIVPILTGAYAAILEAGQW